jgi:Fic family protein
MIRRCILKSKAGRTAEPKTERYALLREIYTDYNKETDPIRKKQYETSGELWRRKWDPFRSRRREHLEILNNPEFSKLIPKPIQANTPFRIDYKLAAALTASSCRLEGSGITEKGVLSLHVPEDAALLPLDTPFIYYLHEPLHVSREVKEAFFHMAALYFGQGLTRQRSTFALSADERRRLHSAMMRPFKDICPGQFRTTVISVRGYHLACFPYPPEVPALVNEALDWMWLTNPESQFLHSLDIFLVFAHLHPFQDGNGRMARLLSALYLAHYGYAPAPLLNVKRSDNLNRVYEAQHLGRCAEFYKFILTNSAHSASQERYKHEKA